MEKSRRFTIILVLVAIYSLKVPACTSFAVYSSEKWYGMNFDYASVDIKLSIVKMNNKKVFLAQFGTSGGYVAGMNENGLFTNYQMLYYNNGEPTFESGANTLSLGDLNNHAIYNLSTANEIISAIGTKKIIPSWDLDLHNLFADSSANAIIVEPFGSYNGITTISDGFIVMSNFPSSDFNGVDYNSVYGVGSERYKTAYSYIKNHKSTFGFNDALETLKRTAQYSGDYLTQVSLIFDPVHLDVYICMQRNYSKVWKVSLKNETIETYSGFARKGFKKLNGAGIWSYNLSMVETSSIDNDSFIPGNTDALIYPNPSKGQLTLDLGSIPVKSSIVRIYNIQGKSVFSKDFKNVTKANINLTGYPKGMYVANIVIDGKQSCTKFYID